MDDWKHCADWKNTDAVRWSFRSSSLDVTAKSAIAKRRACVVMPRLKRSALEHHRDGAAERPAVTGADEECSHNRMLRVSSTSANGRDTGRKAARHREVHVPSRRRHVPILAYCPFRVSRDDSLRTRPRKGVIPRCRIKQRDWGDTKHYFVGFLSRWRSRHY